MHPPLFHYWEASDTWFIKRKWMVPCFI